MRVAKVANIKMRSIRVTGAGLTLVKAASGKCGGVKVTNLLLTASLECDHSPGVASAKVSQMSNAGWSNK